MAQLATRPESDPALPEQSASRPWWRVAAAVAIAAYFFLVTADGLRAPFTADEMMAIHIYWHPSPWRMLSSQVLLWHGYFRPLGAAFYMPPFYLWGLNPYPYHVLLLLLLLIGVWQMYRFARVLGATELAAACAALIACYHGGLNNLYFESVFIYDVLCGLFYLATFVYYARIRSQGRLPGGAQTAVFLALYLCTLNSKEMAVTMPVMLLAYEWLFHGAPGRTVSHITAWLRGPGRIMVWAGLLNLVYIWGKAFGQYGLMKSPAYRPVYSWERFSDFQQRYLGDIFYQMPRFSGLATCAIWLAVTYLCWRRPRPVLRFCWWWIVITPIPIEFIEGRDQACLYVTLGGWALMAATLFTDWLPSAARVLSQEPILRALNRRHIQTALAAAVILLWGSYSLYFERAWVAPHIPDLEPKIEEVIAQFRAMDPHVKPGATVVVLNDPLHNYDMAFIAELWFRDRKVRVILNEITPQSEAELASADAILSWIDGKMVRVR